MLERLLFSAALSLATAWPASAEILHFTGAFHTLYDCPTSGLGTACGSPAPVAIDIPFSFTMEITQPVEYPPGIETTAWQAPEFPLAPPVTQALFESLAGHTFTRLASTNSYESGPIVPNLLSFAQRLHLWSGIDAQGRPHSYNEAINVGFTGPPRAQPGTPIAFDELTTLWEDYRNSGRIVDVYSDASYFIQNADGSLQAAGRRIHGDFRLCRAPSAIAGAFAAVVTKVRGG